MNPNHYAVIMAGGIGSRFWPMSRTGYPKQFHDILGLGRTLLQSTFDRFREIVPEENILIVTNVEYRELVKAQLPRLRDSQILAEPVGRNTAPCMAYANFRIQALNPNAQVVISPADHLIRNVKLFKHDILLGLNACAQHPYLLTLGITPTRPDTGYGYIQFIDEPENSPGYYKVKTFTEKPELEMAKLFLRSGDFLWNSGIFISSVRTLADALQTFLPDTYELFDAIHNQMGTSAESQGVARVYASVKPISIDYGVMEKASNVYVIQSNFDWSDLGTWNSLYEQMDKDFHGNAVTGNAMIFSANNNIVKSVSDKLVVIKGVEDLIVVDTDDVLMILPRSMEQAVKEIVAEVKQAKGDKYL